VSSLRVGKALALCAALAAWSGASACGRLGYDGISFTEGDGAPAAPDGDVSDGAPGAADATPGTADAPPGTPDAGPGTPDATPGTGTAELVLTSNTTLGDEPDLAFTGDGYSIAWSDTRQGGNNRELYLQRVENGALVGGNVRLTNASGYSGFPSLAWSGTDLGVGWEDGRNGTDEVYFVRMDRDGSNVGTPIRLSHAAGFAYDTSVAWTGSQFGIAWEDGGDPASDLYFASVSGTTASAPVQRTNAAGTSLLPRLVWTGSAYGLAWESDRAAGNMQAYFGLADTSGQGSGTDPVISSGGHGFGPDLAWSGSVFGVAYEDNRSGSFRIYLQLVQPDGQLSGSAIDVSGAGPATEAKVAWAGDHWAVAYLSGGLVVLAQMSPDAVPTVARAQVVSGAAGHADNPDLAWTGSAFGLAWQDDRSGNQDIYFREVLP
jgi:hypothetical protein